MTTKGRATETQLGELHNAVAKVMTNALTVSEVAQEVYLRKTEYIKDNPDDPDMLMALPERPPEVPATLLSVITKFLADNKITCIPEESKQGNELQDKLNAMRANGRRKSVGNVVHLTEAE